MRVALLRNERLFTRGQRLLTRDPAAAVEALQAAADASPKDAQAKLFLAIALADAGRAADAIPVLEAAIAIQPRNAVFTAEIGVVHLDEGRPAESRPWFEKAAALSPDNALCAVWPLLARWDEGDGAAAAELSRRTRDRASRFQARVLLRAERCFLRGTRPDCPRDAAPLPPRLEPGLLDRIWEAPRVRRRARAYIAKGRFDAAASLLLQAREDFEGEELLEGLLPKALEGAVRELTDEVQELTRKKMAADGGGAALEADRRDAIFRLADTLLQLERWSEAALRLDEWYASFVAAGKPAGERHFAVALTVAAAETAAKRGQFDAAIEWAARARVLEPDRKEVLRAEALARTGKGEDRAARRLFERFLDGSLYSAEDRLRELITGKKAFIST